MTQAQLGVSWDSYQKNVCKGLSYMQKQGEFVDMTLAADGHYVKVHRMVLSLISPYIKDLITSINCSHPVIFLNNISYPTLCSILEYIYTGEVTVQKENLKNLIQAGKALHIKGLIDMALNIDNEETTRDEREMSNENLNRDLLEINNMRLQYHEDTSEKGDSNSDTETHVKSSDTNDQRTYDDDDPLKLLKDVKDKPPAEAKRKYSETAVGNTTLQYTISNQGGLQMILNRYIYNMRYMSKTSSRRRWRCIHYPRKMRCPAYVTTENDRVIERGCSHNHVFHDKIIMKKIRAGITFCELKDAESQMEVKKKNKKIADAVKDHSV